MELYLKSWPEIESYLKKNHDLIIPVGSTEQHGPTGLIGTDFLSAWEIAKQVGQATQTMVASPVCYGMALHHMAFPGSASLKPSTFIAMMKELFESFSLHGFRRFIVINGHGGNIAPLTSCFSECLDSDQSLEFKLINWWHLAKPRAYEEQHFGDKNGFHATVGEISVTMHTHPTAFTTPRSFTYTETAKWQQWPLSPGRFREVFPDGRMQSDPRLASAQHGGNIMKLAADEIAETIVASR